MFVITLGSIIGMHLFAKSCHSTELLPSTSFDSFTDSMLAVFQLITGDNFGGVTYYLIDCYGSAPIVGGYMILLYIICQYVTINLFVAVFIENFELSEEAKVLRQEEQYKDFLLSPSNTGEENEEAARIVQLKALQLSLCKPDSPRTALIPTALVPGGVTFCNSIALEPTGSNPHCFGPGWSDLLQ